MAQIIESEFLDNKHMAIAKNQIVIHLKSSLQKISKIPKLDFNLLS